MSIVFSSPLGESYGDFELRTIDIEKDVDLIWGWWESDHVRLHWSVAFRLGPLLPGAQGYEKQALKAYLKKIIARPDEINPLIVRIGGVDVGYVEEYRIGSSPLSGHPELSADDRGYHVLVGDPAYARKGIMPRMGALLIEWQLAKYPQAKRVAADPDVRNTHAIQACLKIPGSIRLQDFQLPHKLAAVIASSGNRRTDPA